MRVGIYDNPPKLFVNDAGVPAGFFPEVLGAIAQAETWQLQYVICQWQDCLQQVEAGELDLMMDVAYSPERAQRFQFSQQAALVSWSVIYSRYGSSIYAVPDLHQKRVAVLENSIQHDLLAQQAQAFDIEPTFVAVSDFDTVMRRLAEGQVDAGAVNHFYQIPLALRSKLRQTSIVVAPSQLHFVAPLEQTERLAAIDRQLTAMKANPDSAYADARKRWLDHGMAPADMAFMQRILGLTLLGGILLVWNRTLSREVQRRWRSESRLQHLASNMPGVIYCYRLAPDNTEVVSYISDGCWHWWGLMPVAIMADSTLLWGTMPPSEQAAMRTAIRMAATMGTAWHHEWSMLAPNGQERWVQAMAEPQPQSDGSVVVDGLIIDISDRKQTEAALLDSEARFHSIAANVPGAMFRYVLHPDGRDMVLHMSPGCEDLWEVEAAAIEQDNQILWEMVLPEDRSAIEQSIADSAAQLTPWLGEWRIHTPSGQTKWLQGIGCPQRQADGSTVWDSFVSDITARKHTEATLMASEARYRLLADSMSDLVCLHAPDGKYLYVSPSVKPLLGFSSEELIGSSPYSLFHPDDCDRIRQQAHCKVLSGEESTPMTFRMRTQAGHYIWMETLTTAIRDEQGKVIQLQTTSREVTERIQVQEQLRYDSLHDSLTGLPNRTYLMEQLRQVLGCHQDSGPCAAVLFLDLDRFKVINDSLGHWIGDQLLLGVAQTLQNLLRGGDFAARLGGDEFMIVMPRLSDIGDAVRMAEQLIAAFNAPFTVEGKEVFITPSIGIVEVAPHHHHMVDLLRDADIAMYEAKHRGGDDYEIFDRHMHWQAIDRLSLENDLRKAIDKQELYLVYQPIVELATGRLFGFESLLRWQHPQRGIVSPSKFIPIAEETGLILSIGRWVLQQACEQLRQWQQQFASAAHISLCVNCSVKQLQSPDFLDWLEAYMVSVPSCRGQISLELTESLWIDNLRATVTTLQRIKAQKINLSIDDFGTGYSSLSYLSQLPVDMVKIDRAFISHLQERHLNQEIVTAILALVTPLGMRAVAEGIETPHQLRWLRKLGCELGQGYLFDKPLTPQDAVAWLQSDDSDQAHAG